MPQWETKLGNERIMLLAAYVYSLSDRAAKPVQASTAKVAATTATAPKAKTVETVSN